MRASVREVNLPQCRPYDTSIVDHWQTVKARTADLETLRRTRGPMNPPRITSIEQVEICGATAGQEDDSTRNYIEI
jgi:hypothetical protein